MELDDCRNRLNSIREGIREKYLETEKAKVEKEAELMQPDAPSATGGRESRVKGGKKKK